MHAALPLVVLYFPATHAVHGPPFGPVKPALQTVDTQAVPQVLPLGEVVPAGHETHALALLALVTPEYVPARQFVHTALPVAILYFPATQAVHGPPFGPVKPTLHVQAARAALEIGE